MPISALPPATIRLLGSPLVITTPVSLVKELIENSIDAGATSIEVLISPDTVETVEVRDNGRGIHPTDFDSLGRRGHTSKLRTFDEVKTIGGRTLGFRGEALASVNVLAKVVITTRTSGEPVAAKLHLLDAGGIAKQEFTSAPVGTTVKISGLFHQLPVRRQNAVKEVAKTIPKIKELLQSHALARLDIKYSFKVLGKPKLSWSYDPGKQITVREAVLRVFGSDLVSQCVEVTAPEVAVVPKAPLPPDPQQTAEYVIETFLPKLDADLTMISKRAFVYIDSRPISASKGSAKKLVSMFRTHLNRKSILANSVPHLKDPFIRINIRCSSGSYDPNIEPSKDDVLFVDEPLLLDRFETLLLATYPSPPHCPDVTRVEGDLEQGLQNAAETSIIPTCEGLSKPTESKISQEATYDSNNMQLRTSALNMQSKLGPRISCTLAEQDQLKFQFDGELNTPRTQKSKPLINQLRPRQTQIIRTNHQLRLSSQCISDMEPVKPDRQRKGDNLMDLSSLGSLLVRPPNQPDSTQALPEENQQKPPNSLNSWVTANPKPSQDRIEPSPQKPPSLHPPMDKPLRKMPEDGPGIEHSILRQPRGVPRDLELPQIQQIPGLRPPAPSLAVSPWNPYRSPISTPPRITRPLVNTTSISSRKGREAVASMLQSPPPSIAPRSRKPTGAWPRIHNPQRPGPRIDHQMMDQTRLIIGDDMSPGAILSRLQGSTSVSEASSSATGTVRGRGLASGSTTNFPKSAADWTRPAGRHPPRRDWYTPDRLQTSAATKKEPQGTGLPIGGGRSSVLGRPHHPLPGTTARKIRRLNTELLPLEACSQDTLRLMQTTSVNIRRLTRWLNTAADYDTYVGKGTLEEGLDKSMGSAAVIRIEDRLRELLATWAPDVGTESQIELNLRSGLKGKSRQGQRPLFGAHRVGGN